MEELENLIRQGHFAQARTRASEMLVTNDSLRLKQLYAFSLSKAGVPEAAREFLEKVAKDHPDDPETNGILGGIYKELFKKNQSSTFAILARDTYEKNFRQTRNYYTGINAATMSTLAGQGKRGKEIAQEVLQVLDGPQSGFWEAATQAEAYLLLKERSKSEASYLQARKLAASDWGKIGSVHNQLWLLKHYLPVPQEVMRAFSPPVVVAFVGHMIDHPDRPQPRFPATIAPQVKQVLLNNISAVNGKIGYSSIACGGDILFAEAMEEAGGEVNLFLPFSQADFIEASVRFAGGDWVDRFTRLVNKYPVTYLTNEPYADHADLFALQTTIIFGLAQLRSLGNHQEPMLMTVLSERDQSRLQGGTRDTVAQWPNSRNHISVNPDVFVATPATNVVVNNIPTTLNRTDRPVVYFICCDLSGEEKLNTTLKESMESSSIPPVVSKATTGKLIAGFKTILGAMEFCDLVMKTLIRPFQQKNNIRISLHVGPFSLKTEIQVPDNQLTSPTTADVNNTSSTIERLLILHQLATPGSIYASGTFAAVLALNKKYSLEFIQTMSVEGARPFPVYRVNINASTPT